MRLQCRKIHLGLSTVALALASDSLLVSGVGDVEGDTEGDIAVLLTARLGTGVGTAWLELGQGWGGQSSPQPRKTCSLWFPNPEQGSHTHTGHSSHPVISCNSESWIKPLTACLFLCLSLTLCFTALLERS